MSITSRRLYIAAPLALALALGLAQTGAAGDDEGKPQEPAGETTPDEPPAPTTSPAIEAACKGLACPPSLVGDMATSSYSFNRKSDREYQDWTWLQKADRAGSSEVNEGADGYSVGVGNRGWAKVVHKIEVGPPCSIELNFMCDYNGANSHLLITLCEPTPGKGLAIDWGRRLLRKGGKPAKQTPGPEARAEMRSGRECTIRIEVTTSEVVSTVNGVEAFRAPLTEKEALPGAVGFEMTDARVIFKSITIQGKVNQAWAEKKAGKAAPKKPAK